VLTDDLCAADRSPQPGDEFLPPEFNDDDVPEWWEPYEDTTEAIFAAIDEPVRLSQLLARVDRLAQDVEGDDGDPLDADLLATSLVHAAHRAWAARLAGRSAGDRVVVAVATGDVFDDGSIRSADLLLVPGIVTADIDEPVSTGVAQRMEWDTEDEGSAAA
jgi:hypothetical protein